MSSVNERIEDTLADVTTCIWPLCCPDDSKPDLYIVYNPEIEEAALYADDEDQEWGQYMQVHLYIKGDYTEYRKKIRKLLREADFITTDIYTNYEKDTGYYHLCFSCYTEEI